MLRATQLIICVLTIALLSATASAGEKKAALNGLDPVLLCKGKEVEGAKTITVKSNDLLYYFSSERTRDTFLEDPARWSIQKDAECAVMAGVQGDPARFAVHDQRIYIFGSDNCRTHFLADPVAVLSDKPKVAILIFPGVELLDFAGPGEVFAVAGRHHFDVFTVAANPNPISSMGFVEITPEHTIETAPIPSILVIPGGDVTSIMQNPKMSAWIKRVAHEGDHILSVCNGALVLADLGLLDGLSATSHYTAIPGLQEYDSITVEPEARFVDNGRIITTAGISAGIDGSLHLVSQLLGQQTAEQAARFMEYNWQTEGGLVTTKKAHKDKHAHKRN